MRPTIATLVLLAGACGGGSVSEPRPGEPSLLASKVAVLAVGVATGDEGRSFFDNFLPCPRRGVIDYRNTPRGRHATFTGCDAGDGVVVDGSAEIRWADPRGDPRGITALEVIGPLTVRVGNAAPTTVERLLVSGIGFAPPAAQTTPTVASLIVGPLRVTLDGTTAPLHPQATPESVFRPPLTIDAIPNPGNALDALTEADLKRIAYHGALALASVLFNETLEIQRGEHSHTLPCGVMRVTPDLARNVPVLSMEWNACDLGGGMFESGTFTTQWAELDTRGGRLSMVVDGTLTLGGGVPRTTLSRLEWTISGLGSFPATVRITGKLTSGAQQRTYDFQPVVDD